MTDRLLKLLRSPANGAELTPALQPLLDQINEQIAKGTLTNQAGKKLTRSLDGGYLDPTTNTLYPSYQQIPVMLKDEGISITVACLTQEK